MIKLKTNKNYTKSSIKEIIIYQNKNQIGKKIIYHKLRLKDKLRTNKTFTKEQKTKIRNIKNKDRL
jgi:hypothetical protein